MSSTMRASKAATGRKRYAATVEKGENAWKREWGGFISGMTLKRLQDGYGAVALKGALDLAQSTAVDADSEATDGATFSYLFGSPTEKKAARAAKAAQRRLQARQEGHDIEDGWLSKHQRALLEAQQRGLKLDNMTRKAKREFLHLTVSKEQEAAQQRAREFKLHELMDPLLAWYQQGPHPIDLIAEKLVTRKAEKKGKQAQMRYNYLLPHPSWLARRAQRRRESVLVGLGRRFVFDEDGQARDALHHCPVDLRHANLFLTDIASPGHTVAKATAKIDALADDTVGEETIATATLAAPRSVSDAVLVDPRQARLSFTRKVVKDEAAALAIQKANLTTNYLSSCLVRGPSLGIDEGAAVEGIEVHDTTPPGPTTLPRAAKRPASRGARLARKTDMVSPKTARRRRE